MRVLPLGVTTGFSRVTQMLLGTAESPFQMYTLPTKMIPILQLLKILHMNLQEQSLLLLLL